jgi:putative inorganic carbon (HCO3(-)) transporter
LLLFPTRLPVLLCIGLAVLVLVWLVRWKTSGCPFRLTPLNLALLLLLATVPVAVWASAVREMTTEALAHLLAGVILFTAIVHWVRMPGRAWWVWGGLVAVGMLLVVLAPLGMFAPRSKLFSLPALYALLGGRLPETIHPNVMAAALAVLWPIPLAGVRSRPIPTGTCGRLGVVRFASRVLRPVAVLSTLCIVATLILTQSRGAYLGFAISLLVLLGLRWPKVARLVIPLAIVAALAGATLAGWDRVADELTTGDAISGLDERVMIWSRALYAIQDFSFTGVGLGTFERVVAILYPLFTHAEGTVPHAHNLFLQVAVDLGLPGLVAYLALLGLTFASGFSAYRTFQKNGQSALAGLCLVCIAGLFGTHGLTDSADWPTKLAFIPWVVIGLLVGLHQLAEGIEDEAAE